MIWQTNFRLPTVTSTSIPAPASTKEPEYSRHSLAEITKQWLKDTPLAPPQTIKTIKKKKRKGKKGIFISTNWTPFSKFNHFTSNTRSKSVEIFIHSYSHTTHIQEITKTLPMQINFHIKNDTVNKVTVYILRQHIIQDGPIICLHMAMHQNLLQIDFWNNVIQIWLLKTLNLALLTDKLLTNQRLMWLIYVTRCLQLLTIPFSTKQTNWKGKNKTKIWLIIGSVVLSLGAHTIRVGPTPTILFMA